MAKRQQKAGERRIRVRSKRLKDVDSTKLSLALWLIAQGIVEEAEGKQHTSGDDAHPTPRSDQEES